MKQFITGRPISMKENPMHYCPGCGHGIMHRLICEVVDEFGIQDALIGICPVGCSVVAYDYFDFDMVEVAHGRAPAVATGIKRCRPDNIVFAYQGDGDLASIGMAEIIHAAGRGEQISVFFINNGNYGMTGGQMAPTTLLGQKTTTTPFGRRSEVEGYPMRIPELLASLDGVRYLERVALDGPSSIRRMKKAIRNVFQVQFNKEGFALLEALSPCPTCWRMSPLESLDWVRQHMAEYYPVGVIKNTSSALQAPTDNL